MLSIKNLRFSYTGQAAPVVDIPSFTVAKGEKIFLYGPSGSGKSTLLGLLAGILVPQQGSLEIAGQILTEMKSSERDYFRGAHIGYIFQMFNLIPYLSVRENILLPCELNHKRRQRVEGDINIKCEELAKRLGIESKLEESVSNLSVGQQQRVACARALLGNPELIIADEPTSALDAAHREKFLKLLFDECDRSEATLIFVSHDQHLQALFSRSVALSEINQSKIHPSEDVFTSKPSFNEKQGDT